MAELDECPYEWACSRAAGFVLFHPAGHDLCWLLMFPRANLGIQSHQDTDGEEDAYTEITFPKDPLQRGIFLWVSSLASGVFLQAETCDAPAKAQGREKDKSRSSSMWNWWRSTAGAVPGELGQNVMWSLPAMYGQWEKKAEICHWDGNQAKEAGWSLSSATPFWALSTSGIGRWAALPGHPTESVWEKGQH